MGWLITVVALLLGCGGQGPGEDDGDDYGENVDQEQSGMAAVTCGRWTIQEVTDDCIIGYRHCTHTSGEQWTERTSLICS